MKSYFVVGAKILGIYLVYLGLLNLFQIVTALMVFYSASSEPFPMLTLVSSTGSLILLLIFSMFLLFKTDSVASFLKVREVHEGPHPQLSIQTGIILIGIFIFSTRIGSFLANLYIQTKEANAGISGMGTCPNGPVLSKDLLISTITIIFSLILILGSSGIENVISKFNQKRI
ncbi:MAG: hypothetical protein HUN04_09880 [Desulfobacter sp.]|nr:MAG: hypothetical protein HUN04_09880 [Desulfobacter sp.]